MSNKNELKKEFFEVLKDYQKYYIENKNLKVNSYFWK